MANGIERMDGARSRQPGHLREPEVDGHRPAGHEEDRCAGHPRTGVVTQPEPGGACRPGTR